MQLPCCCVCLPVCSLPLPDTAAAAASGDAAQDADCLLCWVPCSLLEPMLLLPLLPRARVRCLTQLERLWRLLLEAQGAVNLLCSSMVTELLLLLLLLRVSAWPAVNRALLIELRSNEGLQRQIGINQGVWPGWHCADRLAGGLHCTHQQEKSQCN
jgi:hypothetical protein